MPKYYNALNILYEGDYFKLKKEWERVPDWRKIWEAKGQNIDPEKEWQNLLELNLNLILLQDPNYPKLLREIPNPPFGIYAKGLIDYSLPAIAIVGTRSATPQGKKIAKNFSSALSAANLAIVSGLAFGVDEMAHIGAVENQKMTLAVLGTPLDNIYPKQNEWLAKKILETGGGIISEFPLGQKYHKQNFLIRNRIVSGLAQGTLIIEAPQRSGALATARFALEQNRDVFVVPGNIDAKNYQGSNQLIKEGATPVTAPEDILNHWGIKPSIAMAKVQSPEEKGLVAALQESDEALAIEQLIIKTKLSLGQINKNLAMLVIKGIIKESNGKYYL